jgi:hypothetical protein
MIPGPILKSQLLQALLSRAKGAFPAPPQHPVAGLPGIPHPGMAQGIPMPPQPGYTPFPVGFPQMPGPPDSPGRNQGITPYPPDIGYAAGPMPMPPGHEYYPTPRERGMGGMAPEKPRKSAVPRRDINYNPRDHSRFPGIAKALASGKWQMYRSGSPR